MSSWIARRYIVSRRSFQFISVITLLSLTGIAVGVAAIICVSSIFNGFRELYQSNMLGYDPHVRVEPAQGAWLSNAQSTLRAVSAVPGVVAAEGVLRGRAIISTHNTFHVAELHGVDEQAYSSVSGVARSLVVGDFHLHRDGELPRIVVGAEFANTANLQVDDTLSMLSPNFIESALQSLMSPQGIRCVVGGIFYTNSKEYNAAFAYCDRQTAQSLYQIPEATYSTIDVRCSKVEEADELATRLRASLGSAYSVETWYDLHKDLYGVMKFERFASFIILSVIVLVSVFNIFAMLSMTIVKKRSDIAVLLSMGATTSTIRNIFLHEGLMVGLVGTLAGLLLGLGLCEAQIHFKLLRFDQQSFIVNAIPVQIAWIDVGAICLLTVVLSFLATLIPARRAATTTISAALRSE